MPTIFNEQRSNYYKAKKREITRIKEERQVVVEDAVFIHHYGMSAFLELFPEAKSLGISWHREIIEELQAIRQREVGQLLGGIYMASGATKDKKMNRKFRQIINTLTKK